jgi:predicted peptidase
MFKLLFALCTILLLATLPLKAQQREAFVKDRYISGKDTLPFRLLYPLHYNKTKHYPVVVFLHGAGARGKDNELQLTSMPAMLADSAARKKYPCFILAPQCAQKDVWVKFPVFPNSLQATAQPTTSARLTLELLQKLQKQLPLDRNRIYITGYSMGGEGTFDFLTRRPNLFAAAVPICSVADTSKAGLISRVPVWAFHGDQDNVNDVKYSRMMIAALKQHGGTPRYTEYPGIKHNCWATAYGTSALYEWLFAQRVR